VWIVVVPRVALVGFDRVTWTVSFVSSWASSTIVMAIALLVSLGVKVNVPEARVKSVPLPVAVPPVTEKSTVICCPEAADSVTSRLAGVVDSAPLEPAAVKPTVMAS